jgi:hypothetical protein
MKKKKHGRGGARPGAGRKPLPESARAAGKAGKVPFATYVEPEVKTKWFAEAERLSRERGGFVSVARLLGERAPQPPGD